MNSQRKGRLKISMTKKLVVRPQAILDGRWGVVPASEHQDILVALASLIRAQRYEMALTILDNELGGGC